MSIRAKLQEDLKAAMKAKDVITRDTVRMLKSDLEKAELTKGSELNDGEEIDVIARAAKTRKESAAQYKEGGRQDLVDKELAEVVVVERYLPKPLTEDEARSIIEALAIELGVTEKKQMGSLIKEAMARNRGQLDGKMASKIAASVLS